MSRRKIALFGNYGAQNLGDELILEAILTSHPGVDWTVFLADPDKLKAPCKKAYVFPTGRRSLLRGTIGKSWRALKECDAAVIGGGGLFQDNYPLATFIWGIQYLCCRLQGKPVFTYATGVGPLRKYIPKKLTRWVYRGAKGITVRDNASKRLLIELGIPEEKVQLTADPALSLKLESSNDEIAKKRILLSVRPTKEHNTKIIDTFQKIIPELQKRAEVAIIIMQEGTIEDDCSIVNEITKDYPNIPIIIPKNKEELKKELEDASLVISMRYHCLVLALMNNVPVIGINYGMKIRYLLEDICLENYCLDVNNLSFETLKEKFDSIQSQTEQVQSRISEKINSLKCRGVGNVSQFNTFCESL